MLQQWLNFFEKLSSFYIQRFMYPLYEKYQNHFTNLCDSLCLFFEGYAFARNLYSQITTKWGQTATQGVVQSFQHRQNLWNPSVIQNVWQHFIEKVPKPNPKVNPLAPRGTQYGNNKQTRQFSLLEVVNYTPAIQKQSLTQFINNLIQNGDILVAYGLLTLINGISDKITSFFLRDFLEIIQYCVFPDEREILAQPIDTHVKEVVNQLTQTCNLRINLTTDLSFKLFIVSSARQFKLNPRNINMGMWYFRSQILNRGRLNFPQQLSESLNLCQTHHQKLPTDIQQVCQC